MEKGDWAKLFDTLPATVMQTDPINQLSDRDPGWLALICTGVSLVALLWYWQRGEILLYGDAVAHIGIARRIVDSLTPGLQQLGTVWLPLPHLLMLPFVAPLGWWRSGVAASIPSMVAYVMTCVGVFRLMRRTLLATNVSMSVARTAAWLGALAVAANPGLLYLQATAMTEALYLSLLVWALVYFGEWTAGMVGGESRGDESGHPVRSPLLRCGVLLAAAEMTRYDGWFTGAFFVAAAILVWVSAGRDKKTTRRDSNTASVLLFFALVAAAPAFWIVYNHSVYGNALEFATGPYSARALSTRATARGERQHPGAGQPLEATQQYVRAVELNLGEKRWGVTIFSAAVAGALLWAIRALRKRSAVSWTWLLLWVPLPFYILSIAYGSVPIFMPMWWPYAYYNTRYGVQLLPAVAAGVSMLAAVAADSVTRERTRRLVFGLAAVFIGCAYLSCFVQNPNRTQDPLPGEPLRGPMLWREAVVNANTRVAFERKLGAELERLPASSRLLMYTGDHIGALQTGGIPLHRVLNETNWGRWQMALLEPAAGGDYVVAMDGDPVAAAVERNHAGLGTIATVDSPGQPHTVIYRTLLVIDPSPRSRDF